MGHLGHSGHQGLIKDGSYFYFFYLGTLVFAGFLFLKVFLSLKLQYHIIFLGSSFLHFIDYFKILLFLSFFSSSKGVYLFFLFILFTFYFLFFPSFSATRMSIFFLAK